MVRPLYLIKQVFIAIEGRSMGTSDAQTPFRCSQLKTIWETSFHSRRLAGGKFNLALLS